ncbi:hypothetical protein HNY73_003344 [Argiope bruennichi]|uniref:Uncharacterized protein n=1 Tax=Argiope bruennichi TaxID=94029 RepID=A0A8T0G0L4_ARGBR|nr:hypothetical protein HNY73_003344 [Argiope bruennichi]
METVKLNNESIVDAMHADSALREDTPLSPMEPASSAALREDTPKSPMEQESCSALMENETSDALREKNATVKAKSYIVLRFIKNRKFTLKLNFSKKNNSLNSEIPQEAVQDALWLLFSRGMLERENKTGRLEKMFEMQGLYYKEIGFSCA